ncbi:hypothetical protein OG911_27975 [Streptomyces sp. NBC_00208]|uniref:hypothetical protein n=1 Tax=Streptomyces sp. NBC_00208 TaxID=2975681 RepID=UPI002E2B4AF7|nr:hypothetical protein [Streptomyces sp. NBC_00208]
MIIVHTPEGGAEQRFDTRKLLTSEASIAGKAIGMTWPGIREALNEDDPDAMRAIAWVMSKRENPQLRFGDFDPAVDELTVKWDHREISDRVAEAAKVQAPEEERDLFHRVLIRNAADPAAAEALIKEYADGGPKEPADPNPTSMTSDSSTSDSSPSTSGGTPASSTP